MTEASVFTIFGAGGDLAWRKLVPLLGGKLLALGSYFRAVATTLRT